MLKSFVALVAVSITQYVSLALAVPALQPHAAVVCSSGIYGELVSYLTGYSKAQAFYTTYFPVSCTTPKVKRAPAAATTTTTTTGDKTSSAFSKCQQQVKSVISTIHNGVLQVEGSNSLSPSTTSFSLPWASFPTCCGLPGC
jgi:hypothetical protein